jgi:hypothetical protein
LKSVATISVCQRHNPTPQPSPAGRGRTTRRLACYRVIDVAVTSANNPKPCECRPFSQRERAGVRESCAPE